jgi:hypothetical protein
MTMSLVSPPLVAATEMKKGRHTPMPMVITGTFSIYRSDIVAATEDA